MFLIAGLGNPGDIYKQTRHNAGFIAVEFLSDNHNLNWSNKNKFYSNIARCNIDQESVIICKPNTFMNLSGRAISAVMSYHKIKSKNLIVIHDDIDLAPGKIKYKIGGGPAGHNGLKSIDQAIGRDYHRIRIGVGRPKEINFSVSDYVLGKFSDSELTELNNSCKKIAQNIGLLFAPKPEEFKSKIT